MGNTVKRFFKSKKTTHTSKPSSKLECQSLTAETRAPVVDLPLRNPNCEVDNGLVEHRCCKISVCICLSSTLLRIGSSEIGR